MPEYRNIEGYPAYRVGDDGSVWSLWTYKRATREGGTVMGSTWKRLKGRTKGRGYVLVSLSRDGREKHFRVSRLVLTTFVGPCPEGMEACHFPDRDPANNRLDNLRWDTRKNNHADKRIHGTSGTGVPRPKLRGKRGRETNPDSPPLEIYQVFALREGGLTLREIGERFGVSGSHIWGILEGRSYPQDVSSEAFATEVRANILRQIRGNDAVTSIEASL